MPGLQPIPLNITGEEWKDAKPQLLRALNYLIKDMYDWIGRIQGIETAAGPLGLALAFGRQLVACDGNEGVTASTTYSVAFAFSLYIPSNPSTLRLYVELKGANAAADYYIRFQVTDSASTVFTSNEAYTNSTSYLKKTISADLTAAASGQALLGIQIKTTNGSYNASIRGPCVYWDT